MEKTITTYHCDDCEKQVENKNELYQIVYSLYSSNGLIGKIEKEVCSKCFNYYNKLYQEIEYAMN